MTERKPITYGIAPGGADELRTNGGGELAAALPELDATGRDAVIIGMRASAPGRVVPGTLDHYECSYCGERVRLAPSGQRVAQGGARVMCIDCLPQLDAGAKPS